MKELLDIQVCGRRQAVPAVKWADTLPFGPERQGIGSLSRPAPCPARRRTVLRRGGLGTLGGQQESVADQVGHFGEQPRPEEIGVETLMPAQQGFQGADDLPGGQVAVAG